jgi:iron(III) transport system ATP-binding protein
MRVEIRRIQKSLGTTAVYVTHDRVEAMTLSDRVIVMRDGVIKQIGSPQDIYENPDSKFVAGFVGKVAFFPVELVEKRPSSGVQHGSDNADGIWVCKLGPKTFELNRFASDVEQGQEAIIMARPESLRLAEPGTGAVEGTVRMNVYLGHSIETFVETPNGEVLIQIDDPASKKIYAEGAKVSIDFNLDRIRLLKNE